jgi:hypothetical protein
MSEPITEPQLTPERLNEIRDLLKYESSIAFYSHRAKESMLLLVAEAEEAARLRARVAELEAQRDADHKTWQHDLSTARSEREAMAARIAELEKLVPQPKPKDPRGCSSCGSLPESWCPDCAACERGCFGGFVGNECTHANASWGRRTADGITQLVAPTQALREGEPLIVDADGAEPTPLRWGLNDVQWGDDDSVIVMLSGPDGEPYWLELEAVLRTDLAGPDGPGVFRVAWDTEPCGPLYGGEEAARAHCEHDARLDYPDGTRFAWRVYEESLAELVTVAGGVETPTGYTVTRLPLASAYTPEDADADEAGA